MARRTVGPHRTDSHRTYVHETRIIARLECPVLSGAIVWDRVNEELPEFQKFNAAVLGISVDGVWCHLR